MLSMRVAFLAILAVSLAFAEQPTSRPACNPETRESYGLLGPVKSVEVQSLRPDGRRVVTEKYLFDRAGRVLEDRRLGAGDDPEHLEYQVFRSQYARKGPNYEIDDFEIDPTKGEAPIDLQRHLVRFHLRGRCVEEVDIDSDGTLMGKDSYTYDSHGDLVRENERNGDNSFVSVETRTYGPDHKLVSEHAIENSGQGPNERCPENTATMRVAI